MSLINFFKKSAAHSLSAQIRPHLSRLYQQAWRLTQNQDDAEDLIQDLLLRLHEKQVDLTSFDKPGNWLLRALYNQFVDQYRKKARLPVDDREHHSEDILLQLQDHAASPHQQHELTHNSRKIQELIQRLTPDQRALVALHDMEGYTLPELADILDEPLGTLKSRLHRARRTLREQLVTETPELLEPFIDKSRFTG